MPSAIANYWRSPANMLGGIVSSQARHTDFLSNTIKAALLTGAYTPDLAAHELFSDVSGSETSGPGYTAGGQTLTAKTVTVTAADDWATPWAATTVYAPGDLVIPTTPNGHLFLCIVGGTSDSSEPAWTPDERATYVDDGVTWAEFGVAVMQVDADDLDFPGSTFSVAYIVIYNASNVDKPLLCLITLEGGEQSVSGDDFAFAFHANGIWWAAIRG